MQEGKSGCIQACTKGSKPSEQQRSDIKWSNGAFREGGACLWAHWIHSSPAHLSCLSWSCFPFTLKSAGGCFLHSASSSAITMGGDGTYSVAVLGALVQFWRPEVTDGWQPCLLIQREVFSFHMCKCLYTAKHMLSNYFYLKRVSDFHRCNPFPCLHPSLWLSSFSSSLPASCISVSDKHWSGSAPVVLSENYIRAWSQDTSGSCVSDEKADQEVV